MQHLAARTDEQKQQLVQHREWHHATHLKFNRKIYLQQVQQGGHCHLEQPAYALSWKTKALHDLPGFRAHFDQCQYGAQCEDVDMVWRPVKKPTAIQTTKRVLWQEFNKLCDGNHQHCRLEGSSPSTGRRTQFMENYQPTMAHHDDASRSMPAYFHQICCSGISPEVASLTNHQAVMLASVFSQ